MSQLKLIFGQNILEQMKYKTKAYTTVLNALMFVL